MNKTPSTKIAQIKRQWHLIDVSDKILGRVCTEIATKLTGKSKPYFVRHLDCGDYVVVTNCVKIKTTGKKMSDKLYTKYSGYPGGLQTEQLSSLLQRKPEEVIIRGVKGMLPNNKLRDQFLKRLYVFKDEKHPYEKNLKSQISNPKT